MCGDVQTGEEMPYNSFGQYLNPRTVGDLSGDAYRTSAEQLALRVEEFLYDTTSPRFGDAHFLAWSLAAFDHTKQGSGRAFDSVEYQDKETHNLPGIQSPPIPYRKGKTVEWRVTYERLLWDAGLVPNNYDGTQPLVKDSYVYVNVLPPAGSEEE